MTELLYNNNFFINGAGPIEPADGWMLGNVDDGFRTTFGAEGIPPNPSGSTYIIALTSIATAGFQSTLQQFGVPTINSQAYNLTMWVYATGPGSAGDDMTIFPPGGPSSSQIFPAYNIWVPISVPYVASGPGNLTFLADNMDIRTVYIDFPSILAPIICYSGDSLVLVKDVQTNMVKEIEAREITQDNYQVFDISANEFIDIEANKKTGPVKFYALLKKDCISANVPSADFYITKGHYVFVDGKEIKAGKLKQAQIVKAPANEIVYSICTEQRTLIQVNGMAVYTYTLENWDKYLKEKMMQEVN